jgi:hypothetical protein
MWEKSVYPLQKSEHWILLILVYQHLELFNQALHAANKALESGNNKIYVIFRRAFAYKALKMFQQAA